MTDGPNVWDIGDDINIELTLNDPVDGTGLTNQQAFITLTIQRVSDFRYWTGSAWSPTPATLSMTQADATYQPGRYFYVLPGTGGNIQADKYVAHVNVDNPPTVQGDAYEVHVSRQQAVRFYEAEPV